MDSSTTSSLAERFQEGVLLALTSDYDKANEALTECVVCEPGNPEFVAEFLANLARKFRAATGVRLPNGELPPSLAQAWASKNWPELRRAGPRHLAANPWHVPTLVALADAALAAEDYEAELHYLRMALESAPEDVEVNRRAGKSLARQRRFDEALAAWRMVLSKQPENAQAPQALAQIVVERARQRGGLESRLPPAPVRPSSAGAYPNPAPQPGAARPSPPAVALEVPGPAAVRRSPIQQLEAAIREYPARVELYEQITPLYLEKNRDYDAERLLAKGLQDTDNDPRVRELWENVTMIRLEKKLALARQQLAAEDNSNNRAELDKLIRERDRFETETFISRAKREPDNAAVRVELGKRLRRAGKANEAASHFQQALADHEQKCYAAYELGECARELHEFPQALRFYRLAAASAVEPRQLGCRKDALRQAARLAARIKLFGVAQRYISELVRIDPTYTDAASLMRDIERDSRLNS